MDALFTVLVIAFATAAISVTTAKSRVFAGVRSWIASRSSWLGELVQCTYCTSHWVAIALVAVYRPVLVQEWVLLDLALSVFVVVAVATLVSGVMVRLTPFGQQSAKAVPEDELEKLRTALKLARNKIVEQAKVIEQRQLQ